MTAPMSDWWLISNNSKRARLVRLFRRSNGICHWCGQDTALPISGQPGKLRGSTATRDHIEDRWDPERKRRIEQQKPLTVVLACHSCNKRRNKERMRERQVVERQKGRSHEPPWHTAGGPA